MESEINVERCFICNSATALKNCEQDFIFVVRILLEICNPEDQILGQDLLASIKSSIKLCDLCYLATTQAKIIYNEIVKKAEEFRSVQRKLVESLKKSVFEDDHGNHNQEARKVARNQVCQFVTKNGSFNDFGYPFIVQDLSIASTFGKEVEVKIESDENAFPVKDEPLDSDHDQSQSEEEETGGAKQILLIFPNPKEEAAEDYERSENEDDINSNGNDPLAQLSLTDELVQDCEVPSSRNYCKPCKKLFKTPKSYKRHQKNSHPNKNETFHCQLCKKRYKNNRSLKIHQKNFHGENPRKPLTRRRRRLKEKLPKAFKKPEDEDEGQLKKKRISTKTTTDFQCPECHKFLNSQKDVRLHMTHKHNLSEFSINHPEIHSQIRPNSQGQYPCPFVSKEEPKCERIFSMKYLLERHISSIHLADRIYSCDWTGCGKIFAKNSSLQVHMDKHRGTPSLQCDLCDKQFYSRNPLVRHKEKDHEDGKTKKPFICEFCGMSFSCRDYLYCHKSSSCLSKNDKREKPKLKMKGEGSGPQEEICELCGKSVKNLKIHWKNVHDDKAERKFKCEVDSCSKSYFSEFHLKMHLKQHHGLNVEGFEMPPKAKRNVQCGVVGCKKWFSSGELLERHVERIHGRKGEEKEMAWKCGFCGKGFWQMHKWRNHEEVHRNTESRPWKCEVCGKGFPTKGHLRGHKKGTHKMEVGDGRYGPRSSSSSSGNFRGMEEEETVAENGIDVNVK